jgi:hypothetical protein
MKGHALIDDAHGAAVAAELFKAVHRAAGGDACLPLSFFVLVEKPGCRHGQCERIRSDWRGG